MKLLVKNNEEREESV